MPQITFIDAAGVERTIEGTCGFTVMEIAVRNDIPGIEGECGGACACATCHVYIPPEWHLKIGKKERMEEDMLDFAYEVRDNSRLACQIRFSEAIDGLVVHTPTRQG